LQPPVSIDVNLLMKISGAILCKTMKNKRFNHWPLVHPIRVSGKSHWQKKRAPTFKQWHSLEAL